MGPVYLDPEATLEKQGKIAEEAARKGASLVVFPECANPIYPIHPSSWSELVKFRESLASNAISINSRIMERFQELAKDLSIHIVTGFVEAREPGMHNSAVLIGSNGAIVGVHRKTGLTAHERLFMSLSEEADVGVFDTGLGRIGIAMCYEHLDQFSPGYIDSLGRAGEQIHCALWVAPQWLEKVIEYSAKYLAIQNNTWVALACQVDPFDKREQEARLGFSVGYSFVGGSGVISPSGEYAAGPVFGKEEIIYAEIEIPPSEYALSEKERLKKLKWLSEALKKLI